MSSPFGTIAVIADPRAGVVDGSPSSSGPSTSAAWSIGRSRERLLAGVLAAAALDDGFRFLVAVGNDATVQDVVNGMFRDGRPIQEEPVLGVVAAGSGCDLVRSFGLPDDTEGRLAPRPARTPTPST